MSNALAIAAVTSTLQQLLMRVKNPHASDPPADPELVGADITAKPLDRVTSDDTPRLNVFLYHASYNGGMRNLDLPAATKPGEVGYPPLALDLHYLISAYSSPDDVVAHRLLGWAMSLLHDQAVLLPSDIKKALPTNDLHLQAERVRITPHPITTEEMSRLWTMFQTNYRPSVAYQVSVVLIDSLRPTRAGLPVLTRQITATPSLTPPQPFLTSVDPINGQPGARLGELLTLSGEHLGGAAPTIVFSTRLLAAPLTLPGSVTADGRVATVTLPNDSPAQAAWPCGSYTVAASPSGVVVAATAALTVNLVPRIVAITPANVAGGKAKVDAQGTLTLTVQFSPQAWPEQRVTLLLGARAVDAPARTTKVDSCTFSVPSAALGLQFVRLRVDGVDSLVVDYTAAVPVFDLAQSIEVVP